MLVSVIIPVYNAENYLSQCLESVLNQTWENIEIIVVNNNSTDNSLTILKKYVDNYSSKIKLLEEHKQGAPAARNTGLRFATGQWIQFLDADDLLMPDKIEHQAALALKHAAFVAGGLIAEYPNGVKKEFLPFNGLVKGLFEVTGTGQTSSNLWNKKYLMEVNGFDENLPDTQDPDLMFRLFKINEKIIIDKIPKTIVRVLNPKSISRSNLKGSYQRHLALRQRMLNYLSETKPEYLATEKHYFQNIMYKYVRLLAVQDLALGVAAYQKYLPPNFKPAYRKDINNPVWNIIAVRLFGFRRAEYWKTKVKHYFKSLGFG